MLLKSIQLLCILVLSTLSVFAVSKQKPFPEAAQKGAFFRENKGQVKDQNWQPRPDVLFSGESNGLTYHLKKDGLHYQLSRVDSWKDETEERGLKHPGKESHKVPDQMSLYRVDITWLGANPFCDIITGEARPDYDNFYNVPDGVEPALFVKSYASVTYKNLYENIDLKFYQTPNGELEYDFIVHPGGDYKKIQLDIKGATLSLNQKQELEITTPLGTITEGALKVHQEGMIINAGWVLNNETTVSYQIENFNPTLDLTIDPPVRLWGTYYGGNDIDYGEGIATDSSGNVYLTGGTGSTTALVTTGAHQTTFGGYYDAFVVKFDASGTRLWGTNYGGGDHDWGYGIATDASGNVLVIGSTKSTTAIATSGAHDTILGGDDAFVVKFDASGIRLWGTYYGGSSGESCNGIATDASSNVLVTGYTNSTTSISTIGAHQTAYGGGDWDGFIVKFDASGTCLWGTYYGGSGIDEGYGIATDAAGNVMVTGRTESTTAIATSGAHQTAYGGGDWDAFIVKFDASGTLLLGTYYGGAYSDLGYGIATDATGNVMVSGRTESTTAIATSGAHQTTFGGGIEAFVVKFNVSGTVLWGTYYGGNGGDFCKGIAIDASGNVLVTGYTYSSTDIATSGAHDTILGGDDAFVVKFDSSGTRLWGTYYGGSSGESCNGIATDVTGNVLIVGYTYSTNDMATSGAHQTVNGGYYDAFLVKFDGTGSSTGLDLTKENKSPIKLSPNPGQNQLTISGLPEGTIFDLSILNTLGQVVYFSKELLQSENLDINLPNGLYEVIVETKDERYAQKWLVE